MKTKYLLVGALVLTVALVAALVLGSPYEAMAASGMLMAEGAPLVKAEDVQKITDKLGEIEKSMKEKSDEVKQSGEKLMTEVKSLGAATKETTEKVDKAMTEHGELITKHTEMAKRLSEVEQILAKRREEDQPTQLKSLGEMVVEHERIKAFNSATRGAARVQISRKDIMNVTGTTGGTQSQANSLVGVTRVPGIVTPPERKLTIRDLLAPGETSQGMVEYVRETGFTNAAAVVTEGSSKPYSDLTFDLEHAPVRTIAHLFKASRQILDDAPALRSYIDMRARYGLRLEEEDELLNGDGTGAHIAGLIPAASDYNAQFEVGSTQQQLDTIRLAILQVYLAEFPASGIVLNPINWAQIQLLKDGDGRYLIGNPVDGNVQRLWGLPVVDTQSMPNTEFLVGAFNMGAQIFDRMEIEVLLSTENNVDFEKNMVTIRAEERLALAIYRPEAFVHGDFDVAT